VSWVSTSVFTNTKDEEEEEEEEEENVMALYEKRETSTISIAEETQS